jgi:hypothetical protein
VNTKSLLLVLGVTLAVLLVTPPVMAQSVHSEPRASLAYKRDVIRLSRHAWGMDAPTPLFAAQIHQESTWNPNAKSPFASGLAQFTPSTAEWMVEVFPELERADTLNPIWSIRAMLLYNRWLYNRMEAKDECNRWAFALSAYNGGVGWIPRDKRLAVEAGYDPLLWWGNVEHTTSRAAWAKKENREYPHRIIYTHQPIYSGWGSRLICIGENSVEESNDNDRSAHPSKPTERSRISSVVKRPDSEATGTGSDESSRSGDERSILGAILDRIKQFLRELSSFQRSDGTHRH